MKQLGFYFDQTRCIGCETCVVACKDWNDVPAGPASWRRISTLEKGKYPHPVVTFLSNACYHCAEASCVSVCPAGAITKREENGIVIVDRGKCQETGRCGIISTEATGPMFSYSEGESPCQIACPAHLSVPGYVSLIGKGKFKEALNLIREKMPLPSVCGRVCLAPCEKECSRQKVDQSIAIAALKRFLTDYVEDDLPSPLPQTKGEKVAIIGSGPAGLAAAHELIKKGYGVTLYETLPVVGGMLASGIPSYRLPKEILKRDIDYIKALGVEIKTNTPVGKEFTLDDLFRYGNRAILLAMGTPNGIRPDIPGKDMEGVYDAVTFLREINLGRELKVGKKVEVIGGGNAAVDSARIALRKGAEEVHVFYRREKNDMPAVKEDVTAMEEEGIHLHCLTAPKRVLGKNGKVSGLELENTQLGEVDRGGRRSPRDLEERKYRVDCDMVIFAVGQKPDLSSLGIDRIINNPQQGTIDFDPETLATACRGVFACGDFINGPTNVIEAIASGQRAALYIDRYLQEYVMKTQRIKAIKPSQVKVEIPGDIEKQERQRMPHLPVSERRRNFKEVTLGYNSERAMAEAKRCLNCAGHLCQDVCPYDVPQFGAEEKPKMQKCDFCSGRWAENKKPICVDACPMRALDAGPLDEIKSQYGSVTKAIGFEYSPEIMPSVVFKTRSPQKK